MTDTFLILVLFKTISRKISCTITITFTVTATANMAPLTPISHKRNLADSPIFHSNSDKASGPSKHCKISHDKNAVNGECDDDEPATSSQTIKQQADTIKEQTDTIKRQQRKIKLQQNALAVLRNQNQSLAAILADKDKEIANHKQNAKTLVDEMNRIEHPRKPSIMASMNAPITITPARIQAKFEKLSTRIAAFVARHLPESTDHATDYTHFDDLTPIPQLLLSGRETCPFVFQAWIWKLLTVSIFAPSSTFWAGQAGKDFQAQCESIKSRIGSDRLPKFHAWRSQGAEFLTNPARDQKADVRRLARKVYGFFFVELEYPMDCRVYSYLKVIIEEAGNLALLMRRVTAEYTVSFPRLGVGGYGGTTVDEEEMDIVHYVYPEGGGERDAVHCVYPEGKEVAVLVVSPVVKRSGTMDGERYGQVVVAVRSEVVCGEMPRDDTGEESSVDGDESDEGESDG